ncbi:MAG: phage terminase small subunit [Lachnospiraceae bacterium]|nr:phage terminase small subunit [Lachnospiraceae bacterium]
MSENVNLRDQAYADYLQGMKYKEIAEKYSVSLSAVKSWAARSWKKEGCNQKEKKLQPKKQKVATRGAPPGNQNAVGNKGGAAPKGNKNAEKYGFFSKYLPEETVSIMQEMPIDPLDILWDQIQIAYAAIIRAQQIMYVKDREDKTIEKVKEGNGETSYSEEWEVQQAWDKHGSFLQAQARAQAELRSMIKQYDELLHKRWDLASEEQKARIAVLNAKIEADKETPINITFMKASERHE